MFIRSGLPFLCSLVSVMRLASPQVETDWPACPRYLALEARIPNWVKVDALSSTSAFTSRLYNLTVMLLVKKLTKNVRVGSQVDLLLVFEVSASGIKQRWE